MLLCSALSLLLMAGCKGGDSCAELVKKVCADGALPCDKVATWLDGEMTGPDQEKLSAEQKSGACKAILDDKEALAGYTKEAQSKVTK
jgi:hypothetical protein